MTRPAAGTARVSNSLPDVKAASSADQPDTRKLNLLLLSGTVFPRFISRENRNHAAATSLWLSTIVMHAMMFVVLFTQDAWIRLISVADVTVLPPYLASTVFLWEVRDPEDVQGR